MDTIPDLTLVDPKGAPMKLVALSRPLVVYFYPKDDTTGCTREAQDFSALTTDFAKAGVALLGVSKDSPKRHSNFIAKYDLTVPLASDEDGAACEAFGVWVEKSMYGRKYMGIERATFLFGKDGKLVREWRKVKVPGHAAEVLEAARGA
ncbi:MAG: peroxiredoxin [Candidatus Sphingomonas colombiensis]|nr:peroxiredoxin [Sphingomonas sp.]WEK42072.1 MAG: peroxiredoxin [Sphingomonas sp.]